jgi:hypothetical protein
LATALAADRGAAGQAAPYGELAGEAHR